ncbi:MAG: hypothetical protein ACRDTZ_00875 [Pseudonocardiaceae bacterium]
MTFTIMICQTCGRVLAAKTFAEQTVVYQHTFQDSLDHDARPTPMPPDYEGGRCDFCNLDHPSFTVPARSFVTPNTGYGSRGDWAACATCATLIQRNQWTTLITRVVALAERDHGREVPTLRTELGGLYRRLRTNITGALRPVQPITEPPDHPPRAPQEDPDA